MSNPLIREKICDGVHFSSVTDPKFKHNRITVNLVTPLDKKTVTANAVVPFLLRKGCRSCPDFTRLNRRLCELYGASLSCDVAKYGGNQVLELSIYGVDRRFTFDNMDVTGQCAQLLAEILFEPNLQDGVFPEEDVKLERQQVVDAIESLMNEKRAYALSRCRQTMCKGERVAIEKYGEIEEAKALTPEKATKAYQALLETAQIEIIFTGCGDPSAAKEAFAKAFAGQHRQPVLPAVQSYGTMPEGRSGVQEAEDQMDVTQGKLVLGMRAGEIKDKKALMATRLMSAIYGGTPSSRLFTYVREKLSLCYYCASRFDRLTGLMFVDSGVEIANRRKAQEEILHQLSLLQAGDFSKEEEQAALLLMQNSLRSVTDSLGAIGDWYMTQILYGSCDSPAQESEMLGQVTREEIIQAARRTVLDTVYFLTAKEGN